jgi:hypothetical protein
VAMKKPLVVAKKSEGKIHVLGVIKFKFLFKTRPAIAGTNV